MKIFVTVLITLLVVAGIFIAATEMFGGKWIAGKHAIVTIRNDSDNDIKRLALVHSRGFIEVNELRSKHETQIIFENSSENSYDVFAVFENDSIVKTDRRYFEYGYRGKLTITDTGITIAD